MSREPDGLPRDVSIAERRGLRPHELGRHCAESPSAEEEIRMTAGRELDVLQVRARLGIQPARGCGTNSVALAVNRRELRFAREARVVELAEQRRAGAHLRQALDPREPECERGERRASMRCAERDQTLHASVAAELLDVIASDEAAFGVSDEIGGDYAEGLELLSDAGGENVDRGSVEAAEETPEVEPEHAPSGAFELAREQNHQAGNAEETVKEDDWPVTRMAVADPARRRRAERDQPPEVDRIPPAVKLVPHQPLSKLAHDGMRLESAPARLNTANAVWFCWLRSGP